MSSLNKLNQLQHKRTVIERCINEKQKSSELGPARKRINLLFDEGSFIELDCFVKHRATDFNMPEVEAPADGVVTGYGTVNGRLVFAYSQDPNVIDGAIGEMHAKKICNMLDMALEMGAPVIGILDSKGARLQEGLDALSGLGEILFRNSNLSGVVPQITAVVGPCAGSSSFAPAATDFVFMVENKSKLFINGSSVINALNKTELSQEDVGGTKINSTLSGNCHVSCNSEEDCFNKIKRLIDLLPSNNLSNAPLSGETDDINRLSEKLITITDNDYDVKDVINEVVDGNFFFEIQSEFASNVVIGFARFNQNTVGIVANQPKVNNGKLDIDASDKASRFIRFCDSFNIPIVTFVDVEGFVVNEKQEHSGLVRKCSKLFTSYAQATSPKVTVIIGKAYTGAYVAMGSKHLGADIVFAWPTAEISALAPESAASIILNDKVKSSKDPLKSRPEIIEQYRNDYCNPYIAAERGYVNDIIEPDSTRPRIISALEMLASKREIRPAKKHANIPL